MVRPGFYNSEGAVPTARGVSFTIHSVGATGCTLLLFRPQEKEPYARLKYPEAYHIGNTFAMLVFGLKIDEFEYAFQLDGPYDVSMGLLFDKNNVLLDPFAKAVTGQRNWGERPESDEGFVYHARVVENNFDWGKMTVSYTHLDVYKRQVVRRSGKLGRAVYKDVLRSDHLGLGLQLAGGGLSAVLYRRFLQFYGIFRCEDG